MNLKNTTHFYRYFMADSNNSYDFLTVNPGDVQAVQMSSMISGGVAGGLAASLGAGFAANVAAGQAMSTGGRGK